MGETTTELQHCILIVDDNPKNIQRLGNLLRGLEACQIEFATSGQEALGWVGSREFDLILLDVMMPGMSGFEVCRQLKSEARTADIPIIFLTAKSDIESVVKGFELGASDYLTKPFNIQELMARVRTQIDLRTARKSEKRLIQRIRDSLAEIKKLSGMLPICANCKQIRDDKGYWH